jgi:hypothetical protein
MSEFTPLREAVDTLAGRRPSPDFGELKRRAARRGRRRVALVAAAAVAVIAGSAVVAAGLGDDRQTGPVSPSTSSSANPTPTTTPAGDTNIITLNDVDEVTPYVAGDACEFPVSVTTKSKDAIYDDGGDQVVFLYATESSIITNTDNQKVFDATGDAMLVNDFNDDRSQAATRIKGLAVHLGVFTMPGEEKKQTGIILIKGEAEFTQHNMFTPDHWVEFTKITGTPVDVCDELE